MDENTQEQVPTAEQSTAPEQSASAPAQQKPVEVPAPPAPTYTREEVIAGASAFGTSAPVVAGALRMSDQDEFTREEAEAIIKAFLEREV